MLQPARRRVIFGETTRHALEYRVLVNPAEALGKIPHHTLEYRGLRGDRVTKTVQLRARRHPDTGGDQGLPAGLEMEIEASAPLVCLSADRPARRTMMKPART